MRKVFKRTAIGLALGLFYITGTAQAADELLAKTELNRNSEKVIAELWANPIKGGYMNDLTVIFRKTDKSVITAYKPTIKGGYNSLLKPIKVMDKDGDEQLLLSVGQGTWTVPSDFRILDYDKNGKVSEIFGGKESLGVVVNVKASRDKLILSLKNGEEREVENQKPLDDLDLNRIIFDNIYSLTPYDYDKDGVEEIFLDQEIRARRRLLMDVGYMLKYDKNRQKWQESLVTLMSNSTEDRSNTVNEGRAFNLGMFMPRKIVLPYGEGTYPEFASQGFEHENKINKLLQKELQNYLPKVFAGTEDLAFNILRADNKLWSIQLINGKKEFSHHHLNIDPASGEIVKLGSIFQVKNKKFLQTLKDKCKDSNAKFLGSIPDEWYILGDNLYLRQKGTDGKEEVLVFSLESLNDFIIDKKWKLETVKDDAVDDEVKEETAEEKFWKKLSGDDKKDEKVKEKASEDGSKAEKDKIEANKTEKSEKLTDKSVKFEKESKVKKNEGK